MTLVDRLWKTKHPWGTHQHNALYTYFPMHSPNCNFFSWETICKKGRVYFTEELKAVWEMQQIITWVFICKTTQGILMASHWTRQHPWCNHSSHVESSSLWNFYAVNIGWYFQIQQNKTGYLLALALHNKYLQ